jgi:hypothetical protein
MSGGGGKGGGSTANTTIPDWLKQPAMRNIGRAEELSRIGYTPYYGPEVAAFNPTQLQSMQSNMDMASAFGMAPAGTNVRETIPGATDYGNGMWAYSSGDLYDQAVAELAARRPNQAAAYDSMFVNPTAQPQQQMLGGGMTPEQIQQLQQMYAGGRYG